MNKRGFLTRHWIIASLVFSAIIAISFLMISSIADDYSKPGIIKESFNDTYNKFEETEGIVGSMYKNASSEEGLNVGGGTFTAFWSSTTTVIQLIFGSLGTLKDAGTGVIVDAGVPPSIANIVFILIFAIITVIIVLVILSSITQGRL